MALKKSSPASTGQTTKIGEYLLEKTESNGGQALRMKLIKPDGKHYIIAYNPDNANSRDSLVPGWSCSCMGWVMKRGAVRRCKHLELLKNQLAGE
jgi:hypothetical protein